MPTGTYFPIPGEQYEDANGNPAVNYRIFTYLAGTSTKVSTYTDIALSSANPNPLTLGADARPTIFATPGVSYKLVVALPGTDDPPGSVLYTRDNISAVPPAGSSADVDVTAVAGENIAANDACYLSDGSGGTTAGRWYRTDSAAVASSVTAQLIGFATAAITSGASGTIRIDGRVTGFSGLVGGTVYWISGTIGAITATAPANARAVLQADSTTAGVIIQGGPYAGTGVPGVWGMGAQTMPVGIKTIPTAPILSAGATFTSGITLSNFAWSRSTSNATKNADTTLANVTGLSFSVAANEVWAFQFIMRGVTSAAAGWKFTLTGPSAPTAVWFGADDNHSSASASSAAAFGSAIQNVGSGADKMLTVNGLLRNGANAGTVQLQMAQAASDATNTVIYADSYVMAWRVG